jgi:type I restriction enzyme, S subunit
LISQGYKETKIGRIPESWKYVTLLDVAKINPTYRLSNGVEYDFIPMEAVFPGFNGIESIRRRKYERQGGAKFEVGDTLFAKITPCTENGKVAFVNKLRGKYGFGSTEFLVFSPINREMLPQYLSRLLVSHRFHSVAVSKMEGTTGRQRVPKDAFKKLGLGLPPLEEQEKIAEILTAVDDAIEKTGAIIKETQQLKKGLMQKLFTEGIGHTRFKNTKIGRMPGSWEVVELRQVISEFKGGASLTPSDFTKSGVKVLPKIGVVPGGKLSVPAQKQQHCSKNYANNTKKSIVDYQYTIVVLRDLVPSGPSIGLIVKIPNDHCYVLAQGVYGFKVNKEKLISDYLILLSNSGWYRNYMRRIMVGSTQVHIRNKEFQKVCIPYPSLHEQQEIASILSEVDTKIENEQSTKSELAQLKKGLSQVLLTGKLRAKV